MALKWPAEREGTDPAAFRACVLRSPDFTPAIATSGEQNDHVLLTNNKLTVAFMEQLHSDCQGLPAGGKKGAFAVTVPKTSEAHAALLELHRQEARRMKALGYVPLAANEPYHVNKYDGLAHEKTHPDQGQQHARLIYRASSNPSDASGGTIMFKEVGDNKQRRVYEIPNGHGYIMDQRISIKGHGYTHKPGHGFRGYSIIMDFKKEEERAVMPIPAQPAPQAAAAAPQNARAAPPAALHDTPPLPAPRPEPAGRQDVEPPQPQAVHAPPAATVTTEELNLFRDALKCWQQKKGSPQALRGWIQRHARWPYPDETYDPLKAACVANPAPGSAEEVAAVIQLRNLRPFSTAYAAAAVQQPDGAAPAA